MLNDSTNIILGPPGTGKTTFLLSELDKLLKSFLPEHICFISFTKKASYEALERTMIKFDLDEEQLPLFRTMHSLAFEYLRLSRNNVMNTKDYFEVCKRAGVGISFDIFDDFGVPQGYQRGNGLLNIISHSKCTKKTIQEVWETEGDGIDLDEVIDFNEILIQYKFEKTKRDFNDMIIDYSHGGTLPPMQVLIIDEAQDLSAIQWDMADYLSKKTIVDYVAGDDDQSIFEWAGADVKKFISLRGRVKVLDKSWRVPDNIKGLSTKIVSRIDERREKEWASNEGGGEIKYITTLDEVFDSIKSESWLMLGRNNSMLSAYEDLCRDVGVFYKYIHKNRDFKNIIMAIRDWKMINKGGIVMARRIKQMYALMSPVERIRHGFKARMDSLDDKEVLDGKKLRKDFGLLCLGMPWQEALDKVTEADIIYAEKALEIDDIDEPRITISTIHGAKGGEADNVIIISDMGYRAFSGLDTNPDAEHRVWYVAVTRAKKRLFILEPETSYSYDI